MPDALTSPQVVLDLTDLGRGRWLCASGNESGMAISHGKAESVSGRVIRSRLAAWRVGPIAGRVEIMATHPVREVVTTRPGEFESRLRSEVVRAGGGEAEVEALSSSASRRLGVELELESLTSVLAVAAFPLLAPAVEAGHTPDELPEVLAPLLRAGDVRAGARATFGRVTRPLIRAVARRVGADGGEPVLAPLVVATLAAGTCGPEQLTEIIETDPVGTIVPRFTAIDLARARGMFSNAPPRRIVAELQGALSGRYGLTELTARVASWHPPMPERPPPPAATRRGETTPRPVRATAPSRSDDATRARRQRAQASIATQSTIVYPPAWQAADGAHVAGHVLALPRNADDLRHWGQVMNNCLAGFGGATAVGASRILGLVRNRELRYVAEVTPGGVIRQVEGRGNRHPSRQLGNEIARQLITLRLANSDGRNGNSYVAPRYR